MHWTYLYIFYLAGIGNVMLLVFKEIKKPGLDPDKVAFIEGIWPHFLLIFIFSIEEYEEKHSTIVRKKCTQKQR